MIDQKLTLDMVTVGKGSLAKYSKEINYTMLFDLLTNEQLDEVDKHGISDAFGAVMNKSYLSESGYVIPFHVPGQGWSTISCPLFSGRYTDEELHEKLSKALKRIDQTLKEQKSPGIILAVEDPDVDTVRSTFQEFGYMINEYKGKNETTPKS